MATKNRPLNGKVDDPHFVWPPCLCQTPPGRQRLQRSSAIGTTATLPTTRHPPDARWLISHVVAGVRTSGIVGMPHESRQPPAGDRPKERRAPTQDWRAPTQRLAGAFFFNKKRLNDLTKLLEADVSEVVYGVLFGLEFLRLFMYSWFFLFFSFVSASSLHSADYTLTLVLVAPQASGRCNGSHERASRSRRGLYQQKQ